MAQQLVEWVEQFCLFQRKQRGKTEGGVKTYRWNLEQFLSFVRRREGRLARAGDLTPETVQAWMDEMASADLSLSTMRARQSTVSSLCTWLVKRNVLSTNPVLQLDRPPQRREAPKQVPGPAIMDALVQAARARRRPRDVAIFLILRYTGMPPIRPRSRYPPKSARRRLITSSAFSPERSPDGLPLAAIFAASALSHSASSLRTCLHGSNWSAASRERTPSVIVQSLPISGPKLRQCIVLLCRILRVGRALPIAAACERSNEAVDWRSRSRWDTAVPSLSRSLSRPDQRDEQI